MGEPNPTELLLNLHRQNTTPEAITDLQKLADNAVKVKKTSETQAIILNEISQITASGEKARAASASISAPTVAPSRK